MRIFAVVSFLAVVYYGTVFGQEPEAANPAPVASDAATAQALASPSSVEFFDTPLEDALAFLANAADFQHYVHWRSLADLGISPDDQVSLSMRGLPTRKILDMLCRTEIGDLDWYVDKGIVHVTTVEEAENRTVTKVYDVSSLLPKSDEPYAGYDFHGGGFAGGTGCGNTKTDAAEGQSTNSTAAGSGGGFFQFSDTDDGFAGQAKSDQSGGSPPSGAMPLVDFYDFETLIQVIQATIATDLWEDMGGVATISPIVIGKKPLLVVKHNLRTHEELAQLLDTLAQFAD